MSLSPRNTSPWSAALMGCALLVAAASGAEAQPLEVTVNPFAPQGEIFTSDGWMAMPATNLYELGPAYRQPSGYRLRPGSQVPEWVETGDVVNISVPRLPRARYSYFVSPDHKVVFLDDQRRVVRVWRP